MRYTHKQWPRSAWRAVQIRQLATEVDVMITPVVGPEVISGSTRLKAGTATKLVLNMLTTASMVKLGKSAGNLIGFAHYQFKVEGQKCTSFI